MKASKHPVHMISGEAFRGGRSKQMIKKPLTRSRISGETPLLFAKACEYFVKDLTLRALASVEHKKKTRFTIQVLSPNNRITNANTVCGTFIETGTSVHTWTCVHAGASFRQA